MTSASFDDIRPYRDYELPEALQEVLEKQEFDRVIQFIFPNRPMDEVRAEALQAKRIYDLQKMFTYRAIARVLEESSDGFTVSGMEHVQPDQGHLFISNHRDITMDSALLNYTLVDYECETAEIGTGKNLFISPFINGLLRLNKSFKIYRNLSPRELQQHSLRLSAYLRQRIATDKHSMWIAQRNGRTKDGNDLVDTALLKMLGLSEGDFLETYTSLRITPVAISYELEPCAHFKAEEMYHRKAQIPFLKTQEQDLKQMISGIEGPKGRIHLEIGKPWEQEIEELDKIKNKNKRFQAFTEQLNQQIWQLFRLYPFHYIAADRFIHDQRFASFYTNEDIDRFDSYLTSVCLDSKYDKKTLLPFLIDIYARPVLNMQGIEW